jgi:hypothetical protein
MPRCSVTGLRGMARRSAANAGLFAKIPIKVLIRHTKKRGNHKSAMWRVDHLSGFPTVSRMLKI